jgi:hypothetical protein
MVSVGGVRVLGAGRLLKDDEEVYCYACRAVLRMQTYHDVTRMCCTFIAHVSPTLVCIADACVAVA